MELINKLAAFIVALGIFAMIAGLLNRVPVALQWLYTYGEPTAWILKTGIISVGAFLWFISRGRADDMNA